MSDQLDVMQGTLKSIEHSQQMVQKPMLIMHLHGDPSKLSATGYKSTEEGGERWELPYFLINIGKNPAFNISYYHTTSTDSVISIEQISQFEYRWADNLIFPDESIPCGFDLLLRQVYYDAVKTGTKYYRHFVVKYTDEYENHYSYYAVWEIEYEEEGEPLKFRPISYIPANID